MLHRASVFTILGTLFLGAAASAQQGNEQPMSFRIKYATESALYLDGGQNVGLREGMKLTVKRADPKAPDGFVMVAEIQIVGVGSASAVCEIRSQGSPPVPVKVGDIAYLSSEDTQVVQMDEGALGIRKFPQVVTFTEGDPLDEEQREYVPRPPSPEVNRVRGRIGFDYSSIQTRVGGVPSSYQLGMVVRADITRINGTYWNLNGYWRGRLNSQPAGGAQQTLTDLIDRTYTLGLTYANPQSRWVAGAGRLYLPWAVSLGTIDGGYFGEKLSPHVVAGVFGGSTPDPSSWSYMPNRQLGGTFLSYETGSFEDVRFTTTMGLGMTRVNWKRERDFAFTETGIFYKRYLSIYHSMQADMMPPDLSTSASGAVTGSTNSLGIPIGNRSPGITQSFLTVRVQPDPRISFDLNHNYFRNPPTFDPRLVGTGLVEQYLFEGFSGGVRVQLPRGFGAYTTLGRSSRSGDAHPSINQLYGFFTSGIWRTGIRADVHYSTFDSSFGRGNYRALSLTRQFGENIRWQAEAGRQNFVSMMTQQNRTHWINNSLDWQMGGHYYIGMGFNMYRGGVFPYNQWYLTTGYRFQSARKGSGNGK